MRRFSWGTGILALIAAGLVGTVGAFLYADDADPWSPGYRLEEWDRIEAIQRRPLFNAGRPAGYEPWAADKSPLVRAAGALAIGRNGNPELMPHLLPLLDDENRCTRNCALWALLQMDDPSVKGPLLKVAATWKDLGSILPGTDCAMLFWRLGLPSDLPGTGLAQRRVWARAFDATMWTPAFTDRQGPYGNPGCLTRVVVCPERSQYDSGEPIRVRVQVSRIGGREPAFVRITEGTGCWHAVTSDGEISLGDEYHQRLWFPQDLAKPEEDIVLRPEPGTSAVAELTMECKRRPALPGIYLFSGFGASCPVFMRIRRNAEIENRLPQMLRELPNATSAKTLGEQRVRAAAGPLMERFRRNAGGNNFTVAEALAGIGDPKAVPLLLEFPHMRDEDVSGDTSRALKAFGKSAWVHYEQDIRGWQKELQGGRPDRLAMCLRLLPPGASGEADRARGEILDHLLSGNVDSGADREFAKLDVLYACVASVALMDPRRAADAIWSSRDRPQMSLRLVAAIPPPWSDGEAASEVFRRLWEHVLVEPRDRNQLLAAVLSGLVSTAPEVLAAGKNPIHWPLEAVKTIEAASGREEYFQGVAERTREFLRTNPDPMVQLYLGGLYCDMGRFAESEELTVACMDALRSDDLKKRAWYYLARAQAGLGKIAAAETSIKQAVALTENRGVSTVGLTPVDAETIRRLQTTIAAMPRAEGLRVNSHLMVPVKSTGSVVRVMSGRTFYLDRLRRLCAWKPLRRQGAPLAVMPQVLRDFIPLDRNRVFVAFTNGISALYEEGKEKPVWKRTLFLGYRSFLSASPLAVTAADDQGTLHVIDPTTGNTRWTRKTPVLPWPEGYWESVSGPTQQHAGVLLLSEEPRSIECLDLRTGEKQWSCRLGHGLGKVAVGGNTMLAGNDTAEVSAVAMEDGTLRWHRKLDVAPGCRFSGMDLAAGPDGRHVYYAQGDVICALDGATGDMLWKWAWTPRPGAAKLNPDRQIRSRVLPVENGVFYILRWSVQTDGGTDRTDVAFLTSKGKLTMHQTSAVHDLAENAFVEGKDLIFRQDCTWELWHLDVEPLE